MSVYPSFIYLDFLSWSRNAAICAGVGATLSGFDNQNTFGNVLGVGTMIYLFQTMYIYFKYINRFYGSWSIIHDDRIITSYYIII